MSSSWLIGGILIIVGGAVGCLVYELLVRKYVPSRGRVATDQGAVGQSASPKQSDALSGVLRVWTWLRERGVFRAHEGGAANNASESQGAFLPMLETASARIEKLLPMTRADSENYRATIVRAGWKIKPETWRALRILLAIAGGAFAAAVLMALGGQSPLTTCAFVGIGAVVGWTAPRLVLVRAVDKRRRALEAQLPDAMELLGIAISAGSPIEQCFREVAENLEQPLSGEFEKVDREVNLLGHSREQALEHLADRCASRDVSAFVAQLSQAVNQGSSIAESLSSQATLARETAQAAALERIRKMPTKLDIILSFCFLPPTIALVVVPTVVDLLAFLNDTLQ